MYNDIASCFFPHIEQHLRVLFPRMQTCCLYLNIHAECHTFSTSNCEIHIASQHVRCDVNIVFVASVYRRTFLIYETPQTRSCSRLTTREISRISISSKLHFPKSLISETFSSPTNSASSTSSGSSMGVSSIVVSSISDMVVNLKDCL